MLSSWTLLILLLGVECFLPPKSRFGRDGGLSLWLGVSTSITLKVADDGGGGGMGGAENLRGFDMDFAEAMSKPLPEWYNAEKKRREALIKEIEDNRERIIRDFRAKYEVTEQMKLEDISGKQQKMDDRAARRKKSKQLSSPASLFRKFLGSSVKEREGETEAVVEEAEEEETTKEKWEKFWEDEEKGTGFYLPGFFEVFPELQLKWPLWARKKDGSAVPCERDEDCQFPQACCPHPIIPGDKFCCSGWSQRILVPAYARQQATSQTLTRDEQAEKNRRDAEEAAREGKGKRAWQPTDD